MNLSDPTRVITPTLDGPVLAVLAIAGQPLTVGEVAAQSARGSEIGIRRTLARLVDEGVVRATQMGRNRVHELNRGHIAAHIAELLGGLRLELWRRLRAELGSWTLPPSTAFVFGSAARGDGDGASDIDVLLVQPASVAGSGEFEELWQHQLDRLHELVRDWSGNRLQVVNVPAADWEGARPQLTALLDRIGNERVELITAT